MSLLDKLPYFYGKGVTKNIQDSLDIEATNINSNIEDTFNQFFVNSATWGLDSWEKMLGISKNNFDYVTRRENIKAKMRSRGATSIKVIKNICESYSNGEVDIEVNHEDSSFIIHFIGSIGIPKAFDELDKVIEEIKPCHLGHSYKFRYNTHQYLSNYTHEHLGQYTHDDLRNSKDI